MSSSQVLRGRELALAQILSLLQPSGPRLITLTGLPGVGKTRLARHLTTAYALEIASNVGRIGVVEAADVPQPHLLEPAIAAAVGVLTDVADRDSLRTAMNAVNRLVLIDDAAMIPGHHEMLDELLEACPNLTVIATSRAPLRVRGEHIVRVDPFVSAARLDPAELVDHPAVQLFLDVARSSGTRLEDTEATIAEIAKICDRLGGLPLAIELAAARTTAFTPNTIHALLQRSPAGTVLARASATAAGSSDLFTTIAWSESLLSPQQQTLLQDLSAFAGAVEIDAIEAISGRGDLIDDLAQLVDAHLVEPDHAGDSSRFSLHPLIREYVTAQLAADSDERSADLTHRHTRWALGIATRAAASNRFDSHRSTAEAVAQAQPDLLAALARSIEEGKASNAATILLGLAPLWLSHGNHAAQHEAIERVQELADAAGLDAGTRAQIAGWRLLFRADRSETSRDSHDVQADIVRVLDILEGHSDPHAVLRVYGLAVQAGRTLEERSSTIALCTRAIEMARDLGDQHSLTQFEIWSAMLAHQSNELEISARLGATALRRARQLDDPALTLAAAGLLASLPDGTGGPVATPTGSELAEAARRIGDRRALAWIQPLAAVEALQTGDIIGATTGSAEVIAMARDAGVWAWCEVPMLCLAAIAGTRGDIAQAARLHGMVAAQIPYLAATLPPWTVVAYEDKMQRFRTEFGADAFDQAVGAGAALTRSESVDEALAYAATITTVRLASVPPPTVTPAVDLTNREVEVLQRLVAGDSNKGIGTALGISPKTVMHHLSSVYRKLQIRGRAEAVAWSIRHREALLAASPPPNETPPTDPGGPVKVRA